MSYKYYIPKVKNPWIDYWSKTDIKSQEESCKNDEILIILKRYLKKNDKIIDAGCGLGRWVLYLSSRGFKITGVDNYPKAVNAIKKYNPSLSVVKADVCSLSFKNFQFDRYLSFGVVEHFETGPQKALNEAYRVLKTNGLIIMETPYDNLLRRTRRFIGEIIRGKRIFDKKYYQFYEYRYTGKELKSFLKQAGFKVRNCYYKDLVSNSQSIGLWSDVPFFRKSDKPFHLNNLGKIIKIVLKPLKNIYSGCLVIIAEKL